MAGKVCIDGDMVLAGGGLLHGAEQTVFVPGGFCGHRDGKVLGREGCLQGVKRVLQGIEQKFRDREGTFHGVGSTL